MIRRILRGILFVVCGVLDMLLFWIGIPFGFVARSLHDGWLAGFYSVEYQLMQDLQAGIDTEEDDEDNA